MATSADNIGGPATDEAVFVDGEMLGPESDDPVQPHPDPDIVIPKEVIKEEEAEEGKKESGEKGAHNLKSTFIISGVVVAIIGAVFAIAKKIKEA